MEAQGLKGCRASLEACALRAAPTSHMRWSHTVLSPSFRWPQDESLRNCWALHAGFLCDGVMEAVALLTMKTPYIFMP